MSSISSPFKVCILAGGVGSRFWPASTQHRPKQFLDITNTGRSLIQETYDRFIHMGRAPEDVFVITNMDYRDQVADQLPHLPLTHILGEPRRKNTAPAAYAATKWIEERAGNHPILFVPSDHLIKDVPAYQKVLEVGLEFIQNSDALITIGIKPDHPHTGYGYIEVDHVTEEVVRVESFTEKPDFETAKAYVSGGRHLWNAGMFLWKPSTILAEFDQHGSEVVKAFHQVDFSADQEELMKGLTSAFDIVEDESLDVLIMEKTDRLFTLPASFGWSDLGSWSALYDEMSESAGDNVIVCSDHVIESSSGSMIYAPGMRVVVKGLEDYLVLMDGDVLVVCPKSDDQRIKQYRHTLEKQ